jgi:protein ImuB
VIPPGEEASVIGSLPLHLLSASAEMEQTWKLWGLKSFGDLAALPANGIAERLGVEGARLHRIASGAEDRPLIPFIPAPDFCASVELEYPVELLEPLAFILASLLNQVCAALDARGLAASEIRLRLKLQNPAENQASDFERHLSLPVPLRDSQTLLKLLRLDLESHPPQAPIIAASLRAEAAQPRVIQNTLFLPPVPEPEKLELTLARIAKLVGAGNAGSPILLDTHRPDAFQIRPFRIAAAHTTASRNRPRHRLSFRVFRPPLWAEVKSSLANQPIHVRARGIAGKVVSRAGPWRTSGDWWTIDVWDRDEWDVELEPFSLKSTVQRNPSRDEPGSPAHSDALGWQEGAVFKSLMGLRGFVIHCPTRFRNCLCRIYYDLRTRLWYVEGSYD